MTREEKAQDYDRLVDAQWSHIEKTGVKYTRHDLADIFLELIERLVKYEEAAQLFVEEIEEIKGDNK